MTTAIRQAHSAADVALARALFVEYAEWLKVDLCFQGFADELAALPGAYAPPRGRLLLAGEPDSAFGCIALRPLQSDAGDKRGVATVPSAPSAGEVKRLYVQPGYRNGGWGHALVDALIGEAGTIGYRELKLDTLDWMTAARKLYASFGFGQCAPYYANPLPGVVYMSRTL
jgi:putative acetyltransferase